MKRNLLTLIVSLVLAATANVLQAQELNLKAAIEKLLGYYPTIEIARLNTEKARWEVETIESQLAWRMDSAVELSHDVSLFNSPYDRFSASTSLNKKLQSGHSIGITGSYQYDDNTFVLSSAFPNPSQSLNLDLNYRIPLGKGNDNAEYYQSKLIAESNRRIQEQGRKNTIKSLTENLVVIWFDIINMQKRLDFAEKSIARSLRIKNYIRKNQKLGLFEQKDVLGAEAQWLNAIAEKNELLVGMRNQMYNLASLLGLENVNELALSPVDFDVDVSNRQNWLSQSEKNNPAINIEKERLAIADANIIRSLNSTDDKKDLVWSIGARGVYGDSTTGSVSEEDYAARLRFEYGFDIGGKVKTSVIEKSKRDKDIALRSISQQQEKLKYRVNSLVDEIRYRNRNYLTLKKHNQISQRKYNEALDRYYKGRIGTTQLIQFENELHASNLALLSAEITVNKRESELLLLSDNIWSRIGINPYQLQDVK